MNKIIKYVGLLTILPLFVIMVTSGTTAIAYSTDLVSNSVLVQKLDEGPVPISETEPIVKTEPLPKPKPIVLPKPTAVPENN